MNNAIGRITDTLIAISRLIYSGHVERYQGARIVIGIGGAGLPYVLGRMQRNYNLHKDSLLIRNGPYHFYIMIACCMIQPPCNF